MSDEPSELEDPGPSKKFHKKGRMTYDRSKISDALDAIRDGLSIRAASLTYNIPRGTLQDRIHGRVDEEVSKSGRHTVFNKAEEKKLVEWLIELEKCGFPRKKWDLIMSVKKIIKDENRPNPFQDDTPGKKWYDLFMKRHPELNQRTPEGINTARAIVTEEYIRKWFDDLINFLTETNNLDILEDPRRILIGDETAFNICPKSGKVIGPKGWKNIYEIKRGREKETITVMIVITAAGENVKPMVIFPDTNNLPLDVVKSAPSSWMLGISESGWMRGDIFFEYIANGVNTWLEEAEIKKPVILLVDGLKSHLTYELSAFCHEKQIILYALPPNTTHILQPADVSVFRPLKSDWRKTVKNWQDKEAKPITKATFCPLLQNILDKDLTETIKNGFKRCGLYPLNPNAVDYTKCVRNTLELEFEQT